MSLNAIYLQNTDLEAFVSAKKMFRAVSPRFMQRTNIVGYHQWVFTVSSLVCFIDCLARQTNGIIWSDNNLILLQVFYEFTPAF